jgi:N-acetylglucosaminyldiphosphoundecaprenol N-acetyl-beta-D-mannosaminyltransferase
MLKTIEVISKRINAGKFTQHVVVNVAKLVNMRKNPELRRSVAECDIINVDGMGVVWGARLCGHDIPERVAGIDLLLQLLEVAKKESIPVYFLGARQQVIEKLVQTVKKRFPGLTVAGYHHGYFWDNEKAVVDEIAASGARMLFVAISSPKKENFINTWKDRLGVSFVMGVGGSFDVVAGFTRRAPLWMQKAGLEWFYRFLQEPRRMWKRYLVTNSIFAWMLVKEMWGGGKQKT